MNPMFTSSVAERFGWTLFHSLWQFAAIAIAIWIVLQMLQQRSPALRYWVQCCGLMSMVAMACVTFCVSDYHPVRANAEAEGSPIVGDSRVKAPPVDPFSVESFPTQLTESDVIVGQTGKRQVPFQALNDANTASQRVGSAEPLFAHASRWHAEILVAVAPWLSTIMSVWMLGVVLLSVRPMIGWWSVRRLRYLGIDAAPQSVVDAVRPISIQIGVSKVVSVVQSTLVEVPTTIGWIRPMILLPASAVTGLPREQLEAVIAHELAHIRRYDYLVNAIQILLETIFFYHPAIWWVSRLMRIERERCCDEIAVGLSGDRTAYAKLLLWLEESRGRSSIASPALSATGGTLMERIKCLTDPRMRPVNNGGLFALALLSSAIVAGSLWFIAIGGVNQFAHAGDERAQKEFSQSIASRHYSFPDASPRSEEWKATRLFTDARDSMEQATWDSTPIKPQDRKRIRESLAELAGEFADGSLGIYAKRRLTILDWQTGQISADAASSRLKQLAASKDKADGNFTLAMAMTIDARAFDLESIRPSLSSLRPAKTPQFGWFVFEWARSFVRDYPHRGVSSEERMRGQPVDEEHRRSIAVSDWLETQLLESIEESLQYTETQYARQSDDWKPDPAKDGLEAAQMVLALEQIANSTRKVLARTLYPDVSQRATETLLPRTLDLWERAVDVLEASQSTLESPNDHRQKIRIFREKFHPQLDRTWHENTKPKSLGTLRNSQKLTGQWLGTTGNVTVHLSFENALAADSSYGRDPKKYLGQQQSIESWQSALESGQLTRQQQVFAWWRIGSLAAYNFDVGRGESSDNDLAANAFERVHAIGGDLISRETLNAATVYGSLGGDHDQRAARKKIADDWLRSRTDAMIADSVKHINHNGYCIDGSLMPGGMNLNTAAKKRQFLEKELARCRDLIAERVSAENDPAERTADIARATIASQQKEGKQRDSETDDENSDSPLAVKVTQRLLDAAGTPSWKLKFVDEQPTVNVNGFRGYRIVLRRTWQEYTNPPQQSAERDPAKGPFELKHEEWQFVLIPTEPQRAPAKLRSKIPWGKSLSPYHTRGVCMGEGFGFVWFTHGTLFGQEFVREKLKLHGGDDRMALMIEGMRTTDANTMTANSCQRIMTRFGDAALPAIEKAIEESDDRDDLWKFIGSLAFVRTDKASETLVRLYDSDKDDIRTAVAYALVHEPFRPIAEDVFLDMLRRHLRVYESCRACVRFEWKEAVPVLNELIARPENLRELSFTIPARRTLQGNPIPQQLLDARQAILSSEENVDRELDPQRMLVIESGDSEARLLIAIELATYVRKGSSRRINEIGIKLLQRQPRQATVDYLQGLINGMPPENRRQAEQLLQAVKPTS